MKPRGLYELLLTKALAELLTQLPDNLEPLSEPLRSAEAADRISLHLGRAVQKALEDVPEAERGPATYVKHESETPMSVTWRLEHSLPAMCSSGSPLRLRERDPERGWLSRHGRAARSGRAHERGEALSRGHAR